MPAAVAVSAAVPAPRTAPDSLTQPGARHHRRCPACASPRLTTLAMTLTDGSAVDFVSCHDCERRGWAQAGRPLPLSTVLDKARKPRR